MPMLRYLPAIGNRNFEALKEDMARLAAEYPELSNANTLSAAILLIIEKKIENLRRILQTLNMPPQE